MDVVFYNPYEYDDVDDFRAFMGASMPARSMGGLVEVEIGCWCGVQEECFAHVFCFAVLESPFSGAHRIVACDRGRACQAFAGSHIEAELLSEIEDRTISWPEFVSLHANSNPGASMREKGRAWKRSRLFTASVTLLLDDETPRFKLSKLESLHHRLSQACAASPTLRRTIGRLYFAPVAFDQECYPICWLVAVVWLLALLPRLVGTRNRDLKQLVDRVMDARTMSRFVAEMGRSTPTRLAHRTWRMPSDIVDRYNTKAEPFLFDLRRDSGGGFAFVLLEAAMRSVGIALKPSAVVDRV